MLALTPVPLQTDGERDFFAELTRWDTGGGVRAAVVASIPLSDGPLQRRLSDAVLFLPEGIAVLRVAEVVRQSGTVTATPEGAWTIGDGTSPGEILQLGGGGSTPLDGLMRAGMDTAMKLRRAGLEPGRIARVTVLVGDVQGLVPADGDLGEGDQVAVLEPRSLLLGIARAGRYTGVDNPRLWTTADVRAALEALGLQGRGPTVEELNGEGFPYSPYVLRKRELIAPAAMAASTASASAAAQPAPAPEAPAVQPAPIAAPAAAQADPLPPVVPEPAAAADPEPAPEAGAPVPPATSAPSTAHPDPYAGHPARDTIVADAPPPPPGDDGDGIGGLFAHGEPLDEPVAAPGSRTPIHPRASEPTRDRVRTAVFAAAQPQTAPPAAAEQTPSAPTAAAPTATAWPQATVGSPAPPAPVGPRSPGPGHPRAAGFPAGPWDARPQTGAPAWGATAPVTGPPGPPPRPRGRSRRTAVIVAAVLAAVLLLGVGGLIVLTAGGDETTASAQPSASAEPSAPAGPKPGDVTVLEDVPYTVQRVQVDDTCVGHAYGDVATYFERKDCTGLSRALYSVPVPGGSAVVSVSRVAMPDTASAREMRALADTNGSGNVSDLLREGARFDGGPAKLSAAEYDSAVSGSTVTIVEASWMTPSSGGDPAVVDRVARAALVLPVPEVPAG